MGRRTNKGRAAQVGIKRVRGTRRKRHTTQTCNGKVRFRDKPEADRALHLISTSDGRGKRDATPGYSYFCQRCKGHHLSKRSGQVNPPKFDMPP